ncbi:MAG: glycoside hydrolase, partial [Chloroflexota bacterium]|nr:glycoside hydrolase [Chloroflexota bacterium]
MDPRTGRLFVVWADTRFGGSGRTDVALSSSSDGGGTWTRPVRVNPTPASASAFTPAVDVTPAGTVGVSYYDLRADTAAASTLLADHFLARSQDGGATWSESRLTKASFDLLAAPNAGGRFLGDYVGLASAGETFVSVFAVTNSGSSSNRTDILLRTVGLP